MSLHPAGDLGTCTVARYAIDTGRAQPYSHNRAQRLYLVSGLEADSAPHGLQHRLRLFMDLLLHVVLVPALHDVADLHTCASFGVTVHDCLVARAYDPGLPGTRACCGHSADLPTVAIRACTPPPPQLSEAGCSWLHLPEATGMTSTSGVCNSSQQAAHLSGTPLEASIQWPETKSKQGMSHRSRHKTFSMPLAMQDLAGVLAMLASYASTVSSPAEGSCKGLKIMADAQAKSHSLQHSPAMPSEASGCKGSWGWS